MVDIIVKATGVTQIHARLARVVSGLDEEVDDVTEKGAHRLVDLIQEQIRIQDLVETGAYLNSWSVTSQGRGRYAATSDAPQSDRLEYGFVGIDASGRSYADPPRPHRKPAMEQAAEAYKQDLAKVVPKLWGR